jgi:hypothetical protein
MGSIPCQRLAFPEFVSNLSPPATRSESRATHIQIPHFRLFSDFLLTLIAICDTVIADCDAALN